MSLFLIFLFQILKDFLRKFRVQFLDHNGVTGQENCELCIKELRRFIDIVPFENSDQSIQLQEKQSNILKANALKNINSSSDLILTQSARFDSFSSTSSRFANINLISQVENLENAKNDLNKKSNLKITSLKDLTKVIFKT